MFLSGPAAISEAWLGAGSARPQFEKLAPQKAWRLAGFLAACRLSRLGTLASYVMILGPGDNDKHTSDAARPPNGGSSILVGCSNLVG